MAESINAAAAVNSRFTTVSAHTALNGGTTIATRDYHCKVRNLGAHQVSVAEVSNSHLQVGQPNMPAGGLPAAGFQTTLNAAPATGAFDSVEVGPRMLIMLVADTADVLVVLEEIQHPAMISEAVK